MRVARNHSLAASKKESLAELTGRIRQAFLNARLLEPTIRFSLMGEGRVEGYSPIDRVLKRYPEMKRFETFSAAMGGPELRLLTNAASGEAAEYSTILAIAAGVPRSYPFSAVVLHFHAPAFGERFIGLPKFGHSLPGVMVTDNRWVNRRHRALSVYTVVDADEGEASAESGGRRCRDQGLREGTPNRPAASTGAGWSNHRRFHPSRESGGGQGDCRRLPRADKRGCGASRPAAQFAPGGGNPASECRGHRRSAQTRAGSRIQADGLCMPRGIGRVYLTRRTSGNLTVELYLDVGTWSHSVSAIFLAQGAGFKVSLGIPVAPEDPAFGQYPIGDAAQWQRIVENLAAMVRELDRSFVPEIERAAGPTQAWYQPNS